MRLYHSFLLSFLVMYSSQVIGQANALNLMGKGKWEKAKSVITKSIRKDSLNTLARYAYAQYFFKEHSPAFHVDSALDQIMMALKDYSLSTLKEKERMRRIPLDSSVLIKFRERIDSAGFSRAISLNTEQGYLFFLSRFTHASQRARAVELRDEVAYLDALKANTYEVFKLYLAKYPQSLRANEAEAKYQYLLFETMTKDKKLSSYEAFLRDYPATSYRNEVEKNIFEISTADGEAKSFFQFISNYPRSYWSKRALNIGWHILKDNERSIPPALMNDSLRKVDQLNRSYLVPFYREGKFGFIDNKGEEMIQPIIEQLSERYHCGNVTDDVLLADGNIMGRNSRVIFQGPVEEFDDMGSGFLLVQKGECLHVVHKSGFTVGNCVEDARLLDNRWLALKRGNTWSLLSLSGRIILGNQWNEIDVHDGIVTLTKGRYHYLLFATDLIKIADQGILSTGESYDDIKFSNNGFIILKRGSTASVLNGNLGRIIDWDIQLVEEFFSGVVIKKSTGLTVYFKGNKKSGIGREVKLVKPWVALKMSDRWSVYTSTGELIQHKFDSVSFKGPFCIGFSSDSAMIYFNQYNTATSFSNDNFEFIPGYDSSYFLLVTRGENKTLLNSYGDKLFSITAEKIDYAGEDFFSVFNKGKKGLIDKHGKAVLPIEYDGLGNVINGSIPVLKNRKFGFASLHSYRLIKPVFEKNIVPYSEKQLIAFKDGKYGLIGWNGNPLTNYEFDEIRYWNDTCMLVKKNFRWLLFNLVSNKVVLDEIKDFKVVRETLDEKVYIVHQRNNYGVLSNKKGIIIPATFTLIKNLGSPEEPLYFAEKHVEEASVFVVVYYDPQGKLLNRQVFEEDEYEKIVCED